MSAPPRGLHKAIAAWSDVLGAARCVAGTDPRASEYGRDVGEYSRRLLGAILSPESVAEVQAIVRIANTHRVGLYSISTGKNWGMGSRQPVEDHGVVVDLARMNRVRTVNADEAYAIVEPGVTQQALSEALAPTPYLANLTASTPETSLVGNLLDKGIGLYRHRVDDLLGVEVVTGYGELVRAGGYWPAGREMFHFPSGLGPTLTPLFLQSNFGIVTACALRLIPRPEMLHVLYATLPADRLAPALAVLRRLRAEHALEAITKLYNAHAFHAYSGRTAAADDRTYHVLGVVHGSGAWVRHISPFVVETLRATRCFDDITMLGAEALSGVPPLIQALASVFAGTPTHFAVQRAFGLADAGACDRLDDVSGKGFLFVIPIVPATGEAVETALRVLADASRRHDMRINTTINLVSEHAIELVTSVLFDRTPAAIAQAHTLKRSLVEELARAGIPLMRLDVDSQREAPAFAQDSYRDLLARLKRLFDPNAVIAPGRYVPRA